MVQPKNVLHVVNDREFVLRAHRGSVAADLAADQNSPPDRQRLPAAPAPKRKAASRVVQFTQFFPLMSSLGIDVTVAWVTVPAGLVHSPATRPRVWASACSQPVVMVSVQGQEHEQTNG